MVTTKQNVLISPYAYAWLGGPDHASVPEHARIMKGDQYDDRFPANLREGESPRLKGRYLYGGPLKVHFGHIMVDSIIRLWAFNKTRHRKVIFPKVREKKEITDWAYDIFGLFGVERNQVLVLKNRRVFEEVDFAVPGSRLAQGPSPSYLEYLKSLPLIPIKDTPQDVYFGRTHCLSKGSLMGESYFASLLHRAGFVYICPEQHDIHTQTSILRNAKRVVFMEGSSIYSLELLHRIDAPIYMIPRRATTRNLFEPHIVPRTSFSVLGDASSIFRQNNLRGHIKPDSPAYSIRPETIHHDMIKAGLISEKFNLDEFLHAEATDVADYVKGDPVMAANHLQYTNQQRSAIYYESVPIPG